MRVERGLEPGDGSAAREASFSALKRFAASAKPAERCELCGLALDSIHPHLLDGSTRSIACTCISCATLFSNRQDGRFLRIPIAVRAVRDLVLDDRHWEALSIPIDLAFFIRGADGEMRAMYPSPAGAIASSLALDAVAEIFSGSRPIASMQPEVEALLVSRIAGEEAALIVPIDECFRLTGLIRGKWRGLSGGTEVWHAIREFFRAMQKRAGLMGEESHA